MTEDHIKQIAEKADQLIEIIQNIKEKVNPNQKIESNELKMGGESNITF